MYSVYEITNQINGKRYIGITSRSIEERFQEHISRAKCGARGNRLYVAMRKYGLENFTVKLIIQTDDENDVRELEGQFIKERDSYRNGYNCNLGGHGFLNVPEEIKRKIGLSQIGRVIPLEVRIKMSRAKLGDSECAKHFGGYTKKGSENPLAKNYQVKFPDGHVETITGLRAFCRKYGVAQSRLSHDGKSRGFVLLDRFNDYPEREYAQAGGSARLPERVEDIV